MKKGRPDGRKANQLRDTEFKVGVVPSADGSAMFRIGKTIAIAAVHGPRNLYPKFLQQPDKAVLRCNYNMMSFSGSGERVRPGISRRGKEISLVTGKALSSVINLEHYPGAVIDVFIELIQTDAGTRCAGITAAAMALADAGIEMRDFVSAVAVGIVNGEVVVDLSKEEEDLEGAVDIAVAATGRTGDITLLQLDGEISKDKLQQALALAQQSCKKLCEEQQKTLRAAYSR